MSEAAQSVPVSAFTIGGSLVIGCDEGEWLEVGAGTQLIALPATGPTSAAVDGLDGTLVVAGWTPVLRRLRERSWVDQALGAPAIALVTTPRGLVIADASGGLSLLAPGSSVQVQELVAHEPIVGLEVLGDGIAALTAGGRVEVTAWPSRSDALAPIDTQAIGRVHAMFRGPRRGTVLVAGARGLGVIGEAGSRGTASAAGPPGGGRTTPDRPRLAAVTTELGERVAGAAVFDDAPRALVFGEHGEAWIIDDGLGRPVRARLGAAVIGVAAGSRGRVLAWTADGALHAVEASGASRRIADGGVVLAALAPDGRGAVAVRWSPHAGVSITRGHAWS